MLTLEKVLEIHELSIARYGGGNGIRYRGLLESAVERPYASFGGMDFYPTTIEKAAAIMESLIVNHPFIDGNKRTGFAAAAYLLSRDGLMITASPDATYAFVISVAEGKLDKDGIAVRLNTNTGPRQAQA